MLDLHDRMIVREAESKAREIVQRQFKEAGIDNPSPEQVETAALNLLIARPSLYEQAYHKLRRN